MEGESMIQETVQDIEQDLQYAIEELHEVTNRLKSLQDRHTFAKQEVKKIQKRLENAKRRKA